MWPAGGRTKVPVAASVVVVLELLSGETVSGVAFAGRASTRPHLDGASLRHGGATFEHPLV